MIRSIRGSLLILTLIMASLPGALIVGPVSAQDPSFTIGLSPAALTVARTTADASLVTVTSVDGFEGDVELTALSVPDGVTVEFTETPVAVPADDIAITVLLLFVDATTATGEYEITVRGESDGTIAEATLTLTVPVEPDFDLSATPAALAIEQGKTGSSVITIFSINAFDAEVALEASGQPAGVTVTFSEDTATPPADGETEVTVTLEVGEDVEPQTFALTVTATSEGLTPRSLALAITIAEAETDFLLMATPGLATIDKGSAASTTITIFSLVGFSDEVTLSVVDPPEEISTFFIDDTLTPPADDSISTTMVIFIGGEAEAGEQTLTIRGVNGGLTREASYVMTIPEETPTFTLTVAPDSLSVGGGASGSAIVTVDSLNGFESEVDLSVTGLEDGITASFTDEAVTPPADGSVATLLTLNVDESVAPADYPLTVVGIRGVFTDSVVLLLKVPSFTLEVDPDTLSIKPGESDTTEVTVTSLRGFSSGVDLTTSGLPDGVTAEFEDETVTPPPDGEISTTLTITVSDTASFGTSSLEVAGASGVLSGTADLTLKIPGFTLGAAPSSLTIRLGSSGSTTISVTSVAEFSAAVALTVTGLPAQVTASFSPATVTPPTDGAASSRLTLSVGSEAPMGTSTLTVRGTSLDPITSTKTITLTITSAQPPPPPPPAELPPPPTVEDVETKTPEEVAGPLLATTPEAAASVLVTASTEKAAAVIREMATLDPAKTGAIMTEIAAIDVETAGDLMTSIGTAAPQDAATILDAMAGIAPDTAGSVVGAMIVRNPDTAIAALDAMATDTRTVVLSETDPQLLVAVPFTTLSRWLSALPADSYAPLTTPTITHRGSLISSTATSETYMGDVSEGAFTSFFGSPIPITNLLVKFTKSLANVTVTAEQLPAKPAGINATLPAGQIVNTHLNITLTDLSAGDLALGQINFKIDRSWISANNIQPYALNLYRYDTAIGEWVSLPTNRYDQDATYNYYAAITPEFSTFAVAGSSAVPTIKYSVSNLIVTPSAPPGGDITVSVDVANISNETITYVGTLWVDDAIEAAEQVRLTANETQTLTYTVVRPAAGTYKVRVDTLIRSFTIMPTQITALETLDASGAPKTTFAPGETILPSATVKNLAAANATYLTVIQIFAPDLTTLPSQYIQVTLEPAQTFTFMPSVVLPSDAVEGTWTIEVSVFSDFPALGGEVRAEPSASTFTITA